MRVRKRRLGSGAVGPALATVALGLVLACGSESTTSSASPDGGAGATIDAQCDNAVRSGAPCSGEKECCSVTQPDSFGPEGFRCTAGAWRSDSSCVPPAAACGAPLQGSLSRADGSQIGVTCFTEGSRNGVASVALTLDTGETLELYFDRAPTTGDVLPVIEHTSGPRPDAGTDGDGGTSNRASLRIGRFGGFGGFDARANSVSGTLTVTSVEAISPTVISSLRASVDVELTGSPPWEGKLTGSW